MEDTETETPQQDKDVTEGKTQETPLPPNQDENYPEVPDVDQDASDNKECFGDFPTEKHTVPPEKTTSVESPSLPVEKDKSDSEHEEPQSDVLSDVSFENIEDDTPDGAPVPVNEESGDNSTAFPEENTNTTVPEDEGIFETETQDHLPQEVPAAEQYVTEENIETIGPTPHVPSTLDSDVTPKVKDNKRRKILIAALVALVAVFLPILLRHKEPPKKIDLRQIDIFHQEIDKIKVQFPSQREELWKRSRIHLQRHFNVNQPTEPVSIILTAGVRAERTLHCLAQSFASALSSALNASAVHLDGASKSSQDSDEVKSDIDSQLQEAFRGGKPIAVIHRFEELPPASTLIFYRYCDHENAAFKKTFLIFTVLLSEEEEIQANIRLSEVEEMVTDHLQKKFLSHGHPTAFDKMDIDKYGGLWSRISHLILPVATENRFDKTVQC